MSQVFSKSCYTSRSSGYKYRTLATNTGDKKRRNIVEDNVFERKFKELKRSISNRVDKQIEDAVNGRNKIRTQLEKVEAKIDSVLKTQNTLNVLRKDLNKVEVTLVDLTERVNRMDSALGSKSLTTTTMSSELFRITNY